MAHQHHHSPREVFESSPSSDDPFANVDAVEWKAVPKTHHSRLWNFTMRPSGSSSTVFKNTSGPPFKEQTLQLATSSGADYDDECATQHFRSIFDALSSVKSSIDGAAMLSLAAGDEDQNGDLVALATFLDALQASTIEERSDHIFDPVKRTDLGVMTLLTILFNIAIEGDLVGVGHGKFTGWEVLAARVPQLSATLMVLTDDMGRLIRAGSLPPKFDGPEDAIHMTISMECLKHCTIQEERFWFRCRPF
mmetsp:Transcript_83156/g.182694  ORF Transcript_83156/g.182694 Transcript_83156/m.182694 type:complete len:250 (+) Transcript_83156:457-1206(+)